MKSIQQFLEFFFRKRWLGLLVIIALFVGIGISTVYRGSFGPKQRTDLGVFFEGAKAVTTDEVINLYGVESIRHWHYVYSPFLAILTGPFTQFSFNLWVIVLYTLSFLVLLGTFLLSKKFTDRTESSNWQIALAAVLCFPIFLNTLTRGQLGILMLFAQALVFFFYLKGWKTLTGTILAFAVAIKISPLAILFFFFLFKKEWEVLLSGALASLFFWILFPSFTIGYETNLQLLATWRGLMAQGSSITAHQSYLWNELLTPFAGDNQSLYAVITRFVWPTEGAFIAQATNWVRWSVMAGLVVSLFLLFLKKQPVQSFPVTGSDRLKLLAEYSLYPVLMLIFSPVTQIHHYTSLFFLLLAALWMLEKPFAHKKWLLTGIWASAILFFFGFVIEPLSYLGAPMWGAFFLWGVVLVQLRD